RYNTNARGPKTNGTSVNSILGSLSGGLNYNVKNNSSGNVSAPKGTEIPMDQLKRFRACSKNNPQRANSSGAI
ncbi:hypothetical protein, partial [Klebsiella aerogenes]|uniref:hypothetical protein n=1 Tax=Klebsiella aerogenes TaxID=548 RepID=UPI001CBCD168